MPPFSRSWLLLAFALVACGTAPVADPAGAPVSPATGRGSAPAFTVLVGSTTLTGRVVGPAPADRPVTIAVVFAAWCDHCRHELGILAGLLQTEPRFRVIGVNAFEDFDDRSDTDRLRAYLAEEVPWLEVVLADEPLLRALGSPRQVPSVYVFDAGGRMVRLAGRPEREDVVAAVRAAGG